MAPNYFSIAQGSTFCAPGDTVRLCGLVFGNKCFLKKQYRQKFQLCDVESVQYLLRLGQRDADSNLWYILRRHFGGIQLLYCVLSCFSLETLYMTICIEILVFLHYVYKPLSVYIFKVQII